MMMNNDNDINRTLGAIHADLKNLNTTITELKDEIKSFKKDYVTQTMLDQTLKSKANVTDVELLKASVEGFKKIIYAVLIAALIGIGSFTFTSINKINNITQQVEERK